MQALAETIPICPNSGCARGGLGNGLRALFAFLAGFGLDLADFKIGRWAYFFTPNACFLLFIVAQCTIELNYHLFEFVCVFGGVALSFSGFSPSLGRPSGSDAVHG